jgi:hypothetical protein
MKIQAGESATAAREGEMESARTTKPA